MSVTDKFEKIDRWITTITAIPVLGFVIKKVFEKVGEKGAEKLTKKVEQVLGIAITETGEGIGDEILYNAAVHYINDDIKIADADKFRSELKAHDPKKAEAYALYIAKTIKGFERQAKQVRQISKTERTEFSFVKIEEGLVQAKKFILRLLSKPDFTERLKFLEDENVFSLIPLAKGPAPIENIFKNFFNFAKESASKSGGVGKKIADHQNANLDDLVSASEEARRKAKEFYEKSRRK